METGISTACFFGRLYPEDAVNAVVKLGAQVVEIFLNTISEYEETYVKMLRGRLDAAGIRANSFHPFGVQYEPQLFSGYDRCQRDAMAVYEKGLRAAELLGAGITVFHGGMNFKPARQLRLDFKWIGKVVDELANRAADHGIRLAYENVHWCWFNAPEMALRLLENTTSENLYFNFDVKQAAQAGYAPLEFWETMKSRVCNIHLCDFAHQDGFTEPRMPFAGEMDFAALRSAIREAGYNGTLILEVYSQNYGEYGELQAAWEKLTGFFGCTGAQGGKE